MIKLGSDDVLLFQGDSITHGGRVYSDWDMNHIMGHGYQSILASRIGLDNIETCPQVINRGVSGDTSGMILARLEEDILAIKPTVFSLLCGVNDCNTELNGGDCSAEKYEENLDAILSALVSQNPKVKIIIGEPFHFTDITEDSDSEKIEREKLFTEKSFDYAAASRRIARKYGALLIEYGKEFEKYFAIAPQRHLVWDGVHPTYVGHEIMARLWYKKVDEFLK